MNASKLSRHLFSPKREEERVMSLPSFLKVARSLIPGAGLGVFALADIPRATHLGFYTGKKCTSTDGDYVLDMQGYDDDGNFVHKCIDAQQLPGGEDGTNWTRFINGIKTETRNVAFYISGRGRAVKIGVKSVIDIKRGDELLLDYGPEYWT
jgi:hypothetical protein